MNAVAKRPRRFARKLALALGVFVVLALGLEAFARIRFYRQYGTFFRLDTFTTDAASGLRIPVPGRVTRSTTIDSRGFRSPEITVPKPARRVRIAFLGASTTFCAEASSEAATWPALVVERVRAAHPGVDVDYVNAGVAGYVLDEIAKNLELRVKPLAPDVIVLYEATNDLTKDTRELAKQQGVYVEHSDRADWLSETSLAWHLIVKNLLVRSRQSDGASSTGRLKFEPGALVPAFHARYAQVVRSAQAIAPVVAVVTFAQRLRAGQTSDEQRAACITHLYYMPYMSPDTLLAGFAAYNAAIRAVASETNAILIDGEDTIPADAAHFADSVHFTDAGCGIQAGRVSAALEADPRFRACFGRLLNGIHDWLNR